MDRYTKNEYVKGYPLTVSREQYQHPVKLHSHEFSELVIVFSGKGVHFTRQDEYEITAGDCFMAIGAHGYKDTKRLHLANILFVPDRLCIRWTEARKLPGYHAFFALEPKFRKQHHFRSRLRLTASELSRVSALVADIEREIGQKKTGHEFTATGYFMELVGFLSRGYAQREDKAHADIMSLSEVISHIERNYYEQIRLKELVNLACMSSRNFLRTFRNATGRSPVDYLIRIRVRRACELLSQKELSVTGIAGRVGFTDSNYFTRQFRRVMGVSPREYSKKEVEI